MTTHPITNGTRVRVQSDHFAQQCEGVVTAAEYDEGWLYRIDVTDGDQLDRHRNDAGELWVCDFEVHPSPADATP
jgi:hypothetical protein